MRRFLGSLMRPLVGDMRTTVAAPAPTLVRGKRTTRLEPGAHRIINMLSVYSAHKKQPRRLKLCKEDLVRHNVIQAAWRLHQRDQKTARVDKLKKQYASIVEACDTLKELDPELFSAATERQPGKRFSLELRVPTETPPREPWQFDWKKEKST